MHLGDKEVILGLLNLDTEAEVETVEHIVKRAKKAIKVINKKKLSLSSDCGMWFLPRERAFGKIANLEKAAQVLQEGFA